MLSISTSDTLSILDSATIKRSPASVPSCLTLIHKTAASTWSSDNAFVFLAAAQTIHRYDPSSNSLKDFYCTIDEQPISNILSKDKGSLIFSAGENVHVLDCGSTAKISQTFDSHKSPVTSLSLSNDASLLSSTSAAAAHVHNLSLGSHTVLRGLPLDGQDITASAFHPQLRTRLLLGIGRQLVVYDTTRPSGPMKTIALSETTSGDIIAVACSPFSKTLVTVATTGGSVVLIDLEKEKGLFRTFNLKVPLTSLEFSAEGGAIYAGAENGKLIILDLRGLDKPPKTIIISDTGCRIETMSVQKKTKGSIDPNTKQSTTKPSTEVNGVRRSTQTSKPASKAVSSPARARITRIGSEEPPARRLPSSLKEVMPALSPKRTAAPEKKKKNVFSPVRDPHGNSGNAGDISVEIETLGGLKTGIKVTPKKPSLTAPRPRLSVSPKMKTSPTSSSARTVISRTTHSASAKEGLAETAAPRRPRTVPAAPQIGKAPASGSATPVPPVPQDNQLQVPDEETRQRPRAGSSGSGISSRSAPTRAGSSSSISRPGSSISRAGSSPAPPPLPASGTMSPDLPDIHGEPATPLPMANKRIGLSVLGLGTPEVEQWIRAGKGDVDKRRKGKGKTVGFTDESESESGGTEQDGHGDVDEHGRGLAIQISPRHPADVNAPVPTSWTSTIPGSGSPAGGAHDLLRTIVRDVMYDFQRETKAEMTGLHLDLVRMGRGWKRELRDLMGEYVGDLKDLRDENRRLRAENERLRRGY